MYQSDIAAQWFSQFFEKAFVNRVQRRVPMRRLRLDRSTNRCADALRIGTAHDRDYLHTGDFCRRIPAFAFRRGAVTLISMAKAAQSLTYSKGKNAIDIREPLTYPKSVARTLPPELREYFAKLGKKGGLKGGNARAKKLTPEQRSESARKAVQARWAKKKANEADVQ